TQEIPMRGLRFAIGIVPLWLALGVIRAYSQTAPSSQTAPPTQNKPASPIAPAPQSAPKQNASWASKPSPPAPEPPAPKLEHFDLSMVDMSLDPCHDFYQYACSKWNAANPIPADQVAWGTGSGLRYWNENILREAMDKA